MRIQTPVRKVSRSMRILFWAVSVSCLLGCSAVKNAMKSQDEKTVTTSFRVGPSSGGLIENRLLSGISGASDLDAITGATKTSVNLGVHAQIRVKGHTLETGLDYIRFSQSVTYEMPSFTAEGKRDFRFHQLRMPITYNFNFFKNKDNYPLLVMRPGLSIGNTVSKSISGSGNIPDYKFNTWNVGPMFGLSIYPVQVRQSLRIGAYLDLFRGGKVYKDSFHQSDDVGGLSYWMFGVTVQPM